MSTPTEPDVVERVRMALAEAGYPDAKPVEEDDYNVVVALPSCSAVTLANITTTWRAVQLSAGDAACLACTIEHNLQFTSPRPPMPWECLAYGEGIEDCGADRD